MRIVTVRRAWIVGGSLLTIGVLLVWTAQIVSALAHEETTVVDTFPAADIRRLDLRSNNGSVEIQGREVDEITVTAEISHGLRPTRTRATVDADTLQVRSSCPLLTTWCEVDYRIVVPSDLVVSADTDDGRLILRDLTSDVVATNDNGPVQLTRLSGDIRASTDNGRIQATGLRADVVVARSDNGRVRLQFAEPPNEVKATTDNGRVDVVVPDTADTYRVETRTDNGSTDMTVRTEPGSTRSIVARSDNGDVTVRYPEG
jgi:hypothetical protein